MSQYYKKGNILMLRTIQGYDKVRIDEVLTHLKPPAYHFEILESPVGRYSGVIPHHWLETFSDKGLIAVMKQNPLLYRCPTCKSRLYVGRGVKKLQCSVCHSMLGLPQMLGVRRG